MEVGRIITDSIRLMRRTGALWKLATISAVQTILYAVMVGGLVGPMAVLVEVSAGLQARGLGSEVSDANERLASLVAEGGQWLSVYWPPLLAGVIGLLAVWAVSGVLDVAATAGVIKQTDVVSEGEPASATRGMRDGFHVWWKTVALLAVAALPSLIYMLVLALVMFYAVSLPLYLGELPHQRALSTSNSLLGPVSTLVSIIGIPLGIWVALALRYTVIAGSDTREALSQSWRLIRTRFVDVLVMYLAVVGITLLIWVVFAFGFALAAGVGAVGTMIMSMGAEPGGLVVALWIGVGAIAVLLCMLVLMVTLVWQSVAWTLFWRQATGREQAQAAIAAEGSSDIPPHVLVREGKPT